jgi:hypothetical protein
MTGAWNPPIFQPSWAAKFLFEVPEGERRRVNHMFQAGQPDPVSVSYIGNIGYRATPGRFELYLNSDDVGCWSYAEELSIRLLEALPHTPIRALGVNFFFTEEFPTDDLLDALTVNDRLAEQCDLIGQELKSTVFVNENCELGLTRQSNDDGASFNFNYHHEEFASLDKRETLTGCVSKYFEHATELLRNVYGLELTGIDAHDFGGDIGDTEDQIQN